MIAPWATLTAILAFGFPLPGQVTTRAGEIEAARQEKTRLLAPDVTSRTESALVIVKDKKMVERFLSGIAGFRLRSGGLITGSGFATGPEYLRRDFADGHLIVRASARASFKAYQLYDAQLALPKIWKQRLFFDFNAVHRNYPRVDYYGPGPDSQKSGRSNYRLEDSALDLTAGVRPLPHLSLGGTLGFLKVNVGPGTDERFVSTDQIYAPAGTPGIDNQSDFLRKSIFIQYDYRDNPGGPRTGGNYILRHSWYSDRRLYLHSFRGLEMEAQQYLPFFNLRRVIALRGKAVWNSADSGQAVPFYLQPTLGGSDDLRGFRAFRFYDDNLVLMNVEYRWESFSGLDMALFLDAGKVYHKRAEWNQNAMETSVGFGLRFNVGNSVFMRIDGGFSHEGFQFWWKFNNVF